MRGCSFSVSAERGERPRWKGLVCFANANLLVTCKSESIFGNYTAFCSPWYRWSQWCYILTYMVQFIPFSVTKNNNFCSDFCISRSVLGRIVLLSCRLPYKGFYGSLKKSWNHISNWTYNGHFQRLVSKMSWIFNSPGRRIRIYLFYHAMGLEFFYLGLQKVLKKYWILCQERVETCSKP